MNHFLTKVTLFLGLSLLLSHTLQGQTSATEPQFSIDVSKKEGDILVKAIPLSKESWFYATRSGLKFSLAKMDANSWGEFSLIQPEIVRPAPEDEFHSFHEKESYSALMAHILYEQDYVPTGNTMADYQKMDKEISMQYLYYILLSCFHPQLSEMSGLQIKLPELDPGNYRFKVEIDGMEERFGITEVRLSDSGDYIYSCPNLEARPGDKVIELTWDHRNHQETIAAYQVFRSENHGDFVPIGIPLIYNSDSQQDETWHIQMVDSIPQNYQVYRYQIRGYDPFGYFTQPSNTVDVAGRDLTPPQRPMQFGVVHSSPREATFSWKTQHEDDLLGFQIIGSDSETGQYELIHHDLLPVQSRTYTYDLTQRFYRFYRLLAVDTTRNASVSELAYLTVVDTIPPPIPTGLRAYCDSSRVVTLTWDAPEVADLKGYRVFRAYHPSHGFYPLTPAPINEPVFKDTLPRNLNKEIYYRVSALDNNFNHSKPSDYLNVSIPDMIPPTPPLLESAKLNEDGDAEIKWRPSSHNDVAYYLVEYRAIADSIWKELLRANSNDRTALDTNMYRRGGEYIIYRVSAIDSSQNQSAPSNMARVFSNNTRKQEKGEISSAEVANGEILLQWSENHVESNKVVVVYRAIGDGKYNSIGRSETHQYIDQDIQTNTTYNYRMGVIESTGKRWLLSDSVSVTTP